MPWWGAIVIAVTATTIGFAFDAGSGNRQLTAVFASLYFVGCVAAVLAVRQSAVFTAVVQPPLLLFVAVPGAYFLFNQANIDGIKDVLINCGYPLIERFLLMLGTSVVVLLIGAARWYLGSHTSDEAPEQEAEPAAEGPLAGLRAKLAALVNGTGAEDLEASDGPAEPRRHSAERPARAPRRSSRRTAQGTAKRSAASRSRHARPPTDDPETESPRRRRPARAGMDEDSPPPRRRRDPQRDPRDPDRRTGTRDYRPRDRDPRDRDRRERDPRVRDPRDRDLRDPRDRYDRPRRRPNRYESYDPADAYEAPPPRQRRPSAGDNTHHPVSRVRYRGAEDGENPDEYRPRPRTRHTADADQWRYDT